MNSKEVLSTLVSIGLAGFWGATSVHAGDHAGDHPVRPRSHAGHNAAESSGVRVRASQLIGKDIKNPEGKSLGEINDIVLNAKTGEVQYLAVADGGILGIGNSMFAVPLGLIHVNPESDSRVISGDFIVTMNVTPEQLQDVEGFDESHWPRTADANFVSDLVRRENLDHKSLRFRRKRGLDVDVGPGGVDVELNRTGLDVDVDRSGVDVDLRRN